MSSDAPDLEAIRALLARSQDLKGEAARLLVESQKLDAKITEALDDRISAPPKDTTTAKSETVA